MRTKFHQFSNTVPAERLDEVDRLLSRPGSAPLVAASPELRARIMESLRQSPAPRQSWIVGLWPWAAAAAACLAMVGGLSILRPPPAPAAAPRAFTAAVPLEPSSVLRLVAGTVDRPLMEQADRMVSDTKRATRKIVSLVPFTGRGG